MLWFAISYFYVKHRVMLMDNTGLEPFVTQQILKIGNGLMGSQSRYLFGIYREETTIVQDLMEPKVGFGLTPTVD